jgi:BirA family biotin operon repressor/biotin-[acetyl-CoA-carboxylase] ligase
MFLPIQFLEYHEEIPSTNDRILELLSLPIKPKLPCLVLAKRQTAGRGRGDKRWWSGEGALLMSLAIELTAGVSSEFLTRDQLPTFSPTVAQSVINVLKRYLSHQKLELHLPNDVYVEGKKICGILIESPSPNHAVLGLGLNVNNRLSEVPSDFHADLASRSITSMIELLGHETNIARLVSELLNELQERWDNSQYHSIH